MNTNSTVLYEGPSLINRAPITLILAGMKRKSNNPKTGDMLQTFIFGQNGAPSLAMKDGRDKAVCGNCPLRPSSNGGCYVVPYAVNNVHKSYREGRMASTEFKDLPKVGQIKPVRLGAYGNPSAVPIRYWHALLAKAKNWTGYDHRWASINKSWADILMASVESLAARRAANQKGFRTFRILKGGEKPTKSEVLCPGAQGLTTCAKCKLCNGLAGRVRGKLKDVVTYAHGIQAKKIERLGNK